MVLLLGAGIASASERKTLVDGDGVELGTSSNPIKVTLTAGGGSSHNTDVNIKGSLSVSDSLTVDEGVLFVDSNTNRVGINILTPSYALHVETGGSIGAETITFLGTGTINTLDAIDSTTENTLESVLDHDDMNGYVAAEHINWTNASASLETLGSLSTSSYLTVYGTIYAEGGILGTGTDTTADLAGSLSISNALTVDGDIYHKVTDLSQTGNITLLSKEVKGSVIYAGSPSTITLPAISDGDSLTVIVVNAVTVSVDANASDKIWLDGTPLDDGDKISSTATAGDVAVLTYYSVDGWYAVTNSWTDGGA